jgi:hypothetical protein
MATLQNMLAVAGSLPAAVQMAKDYGKGYELDLQLLLAASGQWEEASRVNACRPKTTPREIYASGLFSVMQGDLPKGIYEMHVGRNDNLFGGSVPLEGELLTPAVGSVQDKIVLLQCEGGYGDEIINIRFAKNLADLGAIVIVRCRPDMCSIFERVEGVSMVLPHDHPVSGYHYWLPAMSAPAILGVQHSDLSGKPYLSAVTDMSKHFHTSDGFKVGIKWAGNPQFEHEQFRKFPPHLLWDVVKGYDAYSLDVGQKHPKHIKQLSKHLHTWEDTLGAIQELDLVITSCTSIAHASAALGKQTWVIVPVMPYYTWAYPIEGATSPWYDSVTIFRQQTFGEWDAPFQAIKEALCSQKLLTA